MRDLRAAPLKIYSSVFRKTSHTRYLFIREMGGERQEWRITITGGAIRETWTVGDEVLSDSKTRLGDDSASLWLATRNATLFAAGWRIAGAGAAGRPRCSSYPTPP